MRRQFKMPEQDVDILEALKMPWEAVVEGGTRWLLIYDYPIPSGYNVSNALVALRIPPLYPDDQIDMAYFHPPLVLQSGRGVGALTLTNIDGKQFQQWSRHRTAQNPWRPGLDDLGAHLELVRSWLMRELGK